MRFEEMSSRAKMLVVDALLGVERNIEQIEKPAKSEIIEYLTDDDNWEEEEANHDQGPANTQARPDRQD